MSTSNTTRQIPIVCPGHTRPLAELQFISIDSTTTYLVSACHDRNPMLRNGISGDWIGTFQGHKGAVWSTKLDPKAYLAATASGDYSVKVWDAITGRELCNFDHGHIVKSVDFSLNSQRLATAGHEGILRIFDLENVLVKGRNDPTTEIVQNEEKKVTITKCQWWNDDIILAAASDGCIRVWDVTDSSSPILLQTFTVEHEVRDMELSRQLNILTIASGETVYFFQLQVKTTSQIAPTKGKGSQYIVAGNMIHKHKMPIHFREEGGASLHPSGTKFIAGGSDLWVRVFDFTTGQELECHRGHHGPVRCLRYTPDGKNYATGSEDGTIRLWKVQN